MTNQEQTLIDLVRRVRAAQRAYFANRTPDRLNTSKKLERQLDDALEAYDSGAREVQPGLFTLGVEVR